MNIPKKQISLNSRIQRALLATWLPILLVLIIILFAMLQNMRNQVYATNKYEMQMLMKEFDNNVSMIKTDVLNLVVEYRKKMYVFKNDAGLTRYNIWTLLSEIREKDALLDIGYIMTDDDMDVTYDTKKYQISDIKDIKKDLLKEDRSSWKNYAYQLIELNGRHFFVMQVNLDEFCFGVLIDADAQINKFNYTDGNQGNIDFYTSEIPKEYNKNLLAVRSEETGYYVVRNMMNTKPYQSIPIGRRILLFSALFSLILLPMQWIAVKKYVLRPLERVKDAMLELEQDHLDYRLSIEEKTEEFIRIETSFNQMAEQIKNLRIEAYERDIEKLRIENTNLRLQVNPHLLLNCLNMIFSLAKIKNYEGIEKMAICLSEYFRYILYNQKEFSKIEDEIKFISSYMEIQKIRFPGAFSFVFDIDEELFDIEIPTMLIQNFVENSIKYALNVETEIDIMVIIKKVKDRLMISIVDTGNGMNEGILRKLIDGEKFEDNRGSHIGIWNCRKRLKLHYGEKAVLNIISKLGEGTQVWIEIPINKGEENS